MFTVYWRVFGVSSAKQTDPYDADEPDPAKCGAADSSLWEVATLQQHVLPEVSRAAGFLNKNLPTVEYNIAEFVETTYGEVGFHIANREFNIYLYRNISTFTN